MTRKTEMMRMFCKRAALAAAVILASSVALADEVTLNVPVQLGKLAQGVTKGRVQCHVSSIIWETNAPRGTIGLDGTVSTSSSNPQLGTSSEFSVVNGAYSGTVTVRVFMSGPPQSWIDSGEPIYVSRNPQPGYLCYLQIATGSSAWQPQPRVTLLPMGVDNIKKFSIETFLVIPPAWSLPSSQLPVIAVGTLTAPKIR